MNWTTYWANQPKLPMTKHLKYTQWLQDKNLTSETIRVYLATLAKFNHSFTTSGIKTYFQTNLKKYEANTLKVQKNALNSYLKFKQLNVEWERIARLIPKVQKKFFTTLKEN